MKGALAEPRTEVSKYAPKMTTFNIDPDKIRDVIGTGGKVINDIIAKCDNVKIDVEDSGRITIYHTNRESINKAKEMIDNIVRESLSASEDDKIHVALTHFTQTPDYHINKGIVLSNGQKWETKGTIIYIPVYFVMFL